MCVKGVLCFLLYEHSNVGQFKPLKVNVRNGRKLRETARSEFDSRLDGLCGAGAWILPGDAEALKCAYPLYKHCSP